MIPVYFDPRQVVTDNQSFSPSAGKPGLVVDAWAKSGIEIEVRTFEPLNWSEIALAHDAAYVHGILRWERDNGFGNRLPSVASSLPWTSGSIAAAAVEAVQTNAIVASPTSGFHHAGYDAGGGFCTFNGLVIAAQLLRQKGLVDRVGILDIDRHYGDGTQEIIDTLGLRYIRHWSFGKFHINQSTAREFIEGLPAVVRSFQDCDVVLYQAGADVHIDDQLSGVLTTDQMRMRDHIVFSELGLLEIGCAWNLAGGYQTPLSKVVGLHLVTLEEADRVMGACHA